MEIDEEEDAIMTVDPNQQQYNDLDILDESALIQQRHKEKKDILLLRTFCVSSFFLACISILVIIPVVVIVSNTYNSKKNSVVSPFEYKDVWYPMGDKMVGFEGGEEFGESIDLSGDGNYLAIGSNNQKLAQGKVQVRMYSGTGWRQMGKVIEGSFKGENFGHAVQLSSDGQVLLASGFGIQRNFLNSTEKVKQGVVRGYAFQDRLQTWMKIGNDVQGDRRQTDRFGISLSMNSIGTSFIVSADNSDITDPDCCYAVAYKLSRFNTWLQLGEVLKASPRTEAPQSHGHATAMSGDGRTVCLGDHWFEQKGKVRCYQWKDKMNYDGLIGPVGKEEWISVGGDIVGTILDGQFGYSLSLNYDGTRIAIGNRIVLYAGDTQNNIRSGSVGVYQLQYPTPNTAKWTLMGSEQRSTQASDQGGFDVKLNSAGNVLAWSARGHDKVIDWAHPTTGVKGNITKKNVGMVRVSYYSFEAEDWIALDNNHVLGEGENDFFGESIGLSDRGTILAASSNLNSIEYVRVYTLM